MTELERLRKVADDRQALIIDLEWDRDQRTDKLVTVEAQRECWKALAGYHLAEYSRARDLANSLAEKVKDLRGQLRIARQDAHATMVAVRRLEAMVADMQTETN
jgi:hypothetical protein